MHELLPTTQVFGAPKPLAFDDPSIATTARYTGTAAQRASLRHPSCSEAIEPIEACLTLGRQHGFQSDERRIKYPDINS